MRWSFLLTGALALLRANSSEPLAQLEACTANLKEVEALVSKAKARAADAVEALEKERAAAAALGEEKERVGLELDEQSAALEKESAGLEKLEKAVTAFGKGLEERKAALERRMKALEETEALRNAYGDVVRASETEVAEMKSNDPGDDAAWAAALEMQMAKLQEERERFSALEQQVTGELSDLEILASAWQQDKKQFGTFKDNLEDKIETRAKLEVAVDELEAEGEKLRKQVEATNANVDDLKDEAKTAATAMRDAVESLVKEQGEALDMLQEAVLECMEDAAEAAKEAGAEKAAMEAQHEDEKADMSDAHEKALAKKDGALAKKEQELQAALEPSQEDRFDLVRKGVATGVEGALEDFAKALEDADADEEAKAKEKEAEETVTTTTTVPVNEMGELLGKLHEQMTDPAALHVQVTTEPAPVAEAFGHGFGVTTEPAPAAEVRVLHAVKTPVKTESAPVAVKTPVKTAANVLPRKDGMLRGLVSSRRVSDPGVARKA